MKKKITIHFGLLIMAFVVFASLIALLVSGTAIFFIRNNSITSDMVNNAKTAADELSVRTETFLSNIEQMILPLNQIRFIMDKDQFNSVANIVISSQSIISSLYFIDENGQNYAVGKNEKIQYRNKNHTAINFSENPLYVNLKNNSPPFGAINSYPFLLELRQSA